MKFHFFEILKQMFGNRTEAENTTESQTFQSSYQVKDEKYKPNPFDLLIIAGDSSLTLTSDQWLGGLWSYIDFYPCSGSTIDCLEEMKSLLANGEF